MQRQCQLIASTLIFVLGLHPYSRAQGPTAISPETAKRIDAIFASVDSTTAPGCALGLSQNGTVLYTRGYGMSNLDYDIPITPDAVFDVASITKQFTAFSIALLASEGKLSLDDDIRQYLPELPVYGQKITIRHLLTHTSGLRNADALLGLAGLRFSDDAPKTASAPSPLNEPTTEDDVLRMAVRQKSLDSVPGTEYLYNNGGYVLLAVIVKRVSGHSLREFAETKIFEPLGMHDSQIVDDPNMIVRRRTSAYQPRPGGGWSIQIPLYRMVGNTGLYTTVGDLLKWEQNFADARVGGRALIDEMQTFGRLNDGRTIGYGFGLNLGTYRGLRAFGHGGDDFGYLSDVVRFPDQQLAIAVLCNRDSIDPRGFSRAVAEILLGSDTLEPRETLAPAVAVPAGELAALAGTYWNPKTEGFRRLVVKDGKLVNEVNSNEFIALGGSRFRVGGPTDAGFPAHEVLFPTAKAGAPQEIHDPPPSFKAPFSCMSWFGNCGGVWSEPAVFTRVTVPSYSAAELTAYSGEYHSDELDASYTVAVMPEGGLAVLRKKVDPVPLAVVTRDKFYGAGLGSTLTFVRAPSGTVTGLIIAGATPRHLVFTRVSVTSPAVK
jgi:CubicO group peptidase (beta-lactamase class C family)